MVIRKGIARGRLIELDEPLPFGDGEEVRVSAERLSESPAHPRGATGAEILRALREAPPVDPADVDEMERAIERGRLPVRYEGPFDSAP